MQVVKDNINEISCNDLFETILFIDEETFDQFGYTSGNVREEYRDALYEKFRITLLYEIPTSTVCSSYMFQYGNYTHYFPIYEGDDKGGGVNLDSGDFLAFNDYMILLMKMIMDHQLNGYEHTCTEEEEKIFNDAMAEHKDNLILLKEIEREFEFIKNSLSGDHQSPTPQTVYYADAFFTYSIEMKFKINKENNPRIVILDSY